MKKVVPARTPRVFAIQHPKMSEALIMEDIAGRTYPQLIVWAQMAVMQGFDVSLPNKKEWIVAPLSDTFDNATDPIDLFEDERKNEWQWIMGSRATQFPWWHRTTWHDSSWDSPGDITLTIDSPYTARPWCLEDETISKRLTVSDVVAAWEEARTDCPGLQGMDIEDMDAGSADVVLQYAVLGKCVYG